MKIGWVALSLRKMLSCVVKEMGSILTLNNAVMSHVLPPSRLTVDEVGNVMIVLHSVDQFTVTDL